MQKATLETVLKNCDRCNDGNTVIATFDTVSLYTSIPDTFGLEAFRYFLLKQKEDIHPRFNILFILGSIDITLKNNTFVFDNKYFYSSRVLQWALCLHQSMQTLAWGTMKSNFMILLNNNLDIKQYFVENCKRFLDDSDILLNIDLIKLDIC